MQRSIETFYYFVFLIFKFDHKLIIEIMKLNKRKNFKICSNLSNLI